MKKVAVLLMVLLMLTTMALADWDAIYEDQTVDVWADHWSAFYDMDLTIFRIDNYYEHYGDYWASYYLYGYNHWLGLYVYDFDYATFSEWIWLYSTY